jgi:hypothetical protein
MAEPRAELSDPRVRVVWEAFKREGWIINSLVMAQVAVAALDQAQPPNP